MCPGDAGAVWNPKPTAAADQSIRVTTDNGLHEKGSFAALWFSYFSKTEKKTTA